MSLQILPTDFSPLFVFFLGKNVGGVGGGGGRLNGTLTVVCKPYFYIIKVGTKFCNFQFVSVVGVHVLKKVYFIFICFFKTRILYNIKSYRILRLSSWFPNKMVCMIFHDLPPHLSPLSLFVYLFRLPHLPSTPPPK